MSADPYVVCVTGGRDFCSTPVLYAALDRVHEARRIDLLVHGGAPGADALASAWAHSRKVDLRIYGAKWGTHGSAAGPERNRAMLDGSKPALVLAFPMEHSRGTWGCVSEARKRGINVEVCGP